MRLIPEGAFAEADAATRTVLEALARAYPSDDVFVWWEPPFDFKGSEPSLVLFDPSTGLVAIEVCSAPDDSEIDDADALFSAFGWWPSPHARANGWSHVLKARVAGSAALRGVAVGVTFLAVFPFVSASSSLAAELRRKTRDRFLVLAEDIEPTALHGRIVGAFDGTVELGRARSQLDAIKAVVDPTVIISPRSRVGTVAILDEAQEGLAKSLQARQVVVGVAGSGKTVVLVARARLLEPAGPVLVTCHTRSLAAWLRGRVPPGVHVEHAQGLLRRLHGEAGHPWPGFDDSDALAESFEAVRTTLGQASSFRHVLIDEAQDFPRSILRTLVGLQSGDGTVLVVGDSEQKVFAEGDLPKSDEEWAAVGVPIERAPDGRPRNKRVLRRCYRNTREILGFARHVTGLGREVASSTPRSGPRPTIEVVEAADAEPDAVVRAVTKCLATSSPNQPAAVAVLYVSGREGRDDERHLRSARIYETLAREWSTLWANDPDDEAARERMAGTAAQVVLASAHLAKGLDFPAVVIVGLGGPDPWERIRRALYVGMTRAVDELCVVARADDALLASALDATAA